MTYENLLYELRDGVARITFNRPKAYNAITLDSCRELCDIVNRVSSDKSVRAVVLTGAGEKAFCAGGDVTTFAAAGDGVEVLVKQMTGYLHMAVSRLAWMDAPVIAAVNGVAAGAVGRRSAGLGSDQPRRSGFRSGRRSRPPGLADRGRLHGGLQCWQAASDVVGRR